MKKYLLLILSITLLSCGGDSAEEVYQPIPVSLEIPQLFEQQILDPIIPNDNPLTEEGIALGKRLFFDRRLSRNNSKSCASCHNPRQAFSDITQFSVGIEGQTGVRNAMPIFNLAWNFNDRFNWDGSEFGLEDQAFEPVTNPIEMHGQMRLKNCKRILNIQKCSFEHSEPERLIQP
jgi:cytochrome c peroxidase